MAFVADGSAWASVADGSGLTCLFPIDDAAPFAWGPLGDRVLIAGLEVKGVAGGPSLAAQGVTPAAVTWTRPTGASIVFAPPGGASLEKVHLDGSATQHVTPLPESTYLSVAYHPSGEAFAFAVRQGTDESIWISTNKGKTPQRLVFSVEGTRFGAIGFDVDGRHLLYAAEHADGHPELHRIDIADPSAAPVMWSGPEGSTIENVEPGPLTDTFAWTARAGACTDTTAMVQTAKGTTTLVPGAGRPTRVVGWLDPTTILVAAGACEEPLDLSAVSVTDGSFVPIISGVAAAGVRTPVPAPAAALPKPVANLGSGFS